MNTKDTVEALRLMASTIEELEIDNIIAVEYSFGEMTCHLNTMKVTPNNNATWIELFEPTYAWKKIFIHNNIKFFAIYTQEAYDKENQA